MNCTSCSPLVSEGEHGWGMPSNSAARQVLAEGSWSCPLCQSSGEAGRQVLCGHRGCPVEVNPVSVCWVSSSRLLWLGDGGPHLVVGLLAWPCSCC